MVVLVASKPAALLALRPASVLKLTTWAVIMLVLPEPVARLVGRAREEALVVAAIGAPFEHEAAVPLGQAAIRFAAPLSAIPPVAPLTPPAAGLLAPPLTAPVLSSILVTPAVRVAIAILAVPVPQISMCHAWSPFRCKGGL